jgi:hypothetical protein
MRDVTRRSESHGGHFDPYYACTLSAITHNKNVFRTRVDVATDFFFFYYVKLGTKVWPHLSVTFCTMHRYLSETLK